MSILLEIVRNVIVIVMIASFLEILLPDGKIKPFVRFAIGLFVIVAVLNPALSLLFSGRDFNVDLWDYKVEAIQSERVLESGMDINRQIASKNDEMVKNKLQGQIGAFVMLVPGVQEVESRVEINDAGALTRVFLKVEVEKLQEAEAVPGMPIQESTVSNEEFAAVLEKKIVTILENFYGLDGVDINIEFNKDVL